MTGGNAKSPGLTRRAISSGLPGQLQPEPANPHRVRLLELAADYEKSGHGWFWSTGPDGKLSYVSECVSQVLGKAVDQLVGQPVQALLTIEPDEAGDCERSLAKILGARRSFANLPARPANRNIELWWAITGRPQFDHAGHFQGYYGNAIDITAARQSHRDVLQLQRVPSLGGFSARPAGGDGARASRSILDHGLRPGGPGARVLPAERRRQIEDDLRHAVARGQIRVVYQPIVDASDNRVVALEALARWEHPEFGDIPPDIFIPIAEETNVIGQLGDWILQQACGDAVCWPGEVRVSVNVSAAQFANHGFLALVARALGHAGLAPERLELELTETVFLGDKTAAEETFGALKMLGIRLALDDFGTGYSSLSYLQHARFDKIKIDKSFMAEITQPDSRNAAIIASIVGLAKALNMDTTAEGIEAHDELEATRQLGVNQIQGFIYAAALTGQEVLDHLVDGEWVIEPDAHSTPALEPVEILYPLSRYRRARLRPGALKVA